MLLAALMLLTGCTAANTYLISATDVPGTNPVLPEAVDETPLDTRGEATLWFRFLNEPCLAAETRQVTQLPGQSYEMALLSSLLTGPGTRQTELTNPFPVGAQVLSTVLQGRTLLVTLSPEILNALTDEPVDWQESDAWRVEAPLRRRLAMQAIAATVTDNCDVDEVLVLVNQDSSRQGSLRLKQNYYLDDSEEDVLADPLRRDESLLLSPATLPGILAQCWLQRDWIRLYRYLTATDSGTGQSRPASRDFAALMDSLPSLSAATAAGGSVNGDGQRAAFTLTATVVRSGSEPRTLRNRVLHLRRENGLWKIDLSQLTGWLEEP